MSGEAEWVVEADVSCGKCGYNVRTLAVTARCPECGFPVLRSFIGHEAGVSRGSPVDAERLVRTAQLVLSRLLRRNVDAIAAVMLAQRHAARKQSGDAPRLLPRRVDVSAADLCRAVAEYVLDHYGNPQDARATLRFWRVERSEDVGEIVSGLVEAGLMTPGPNDSPADFVGVCHFDDFFQSP